MQSAVSIMKSLVPITQFNKGQAAKIFDRVKSERRLVVLKNNAPSAVIMSPEEYERLAEIEENYYLLSLAERRLKDGGIPVGVSEVMRRLGISPDSVQSAEELEIE